MQSSYSSGATPDLAAVDPAGSTRREARLRGEYAHHYPGLPSGRWECAATLADRVLATWLLRGTALVFRSRPLGEGHFEFRGGAGRRSSGESDRPRREDR
jgi:hypothetical protein